MHKSGFENVMIHQDEASSGYLHVNFIPRHKWTYQFSSNLEEMRIYAKEILNTSKEYKNDLFNTINKIRDDFK